MWVWEELRVGETPGVKGQHAFDNLRLKLRREAGWDTDTGGKRPQIENRASSEPQSPKEKSALRPEKTQQRRREAGTSLLNFNVLLVSSHSQEIELMFQYLPSLLLVLIPFLEES